MARISLQHPQNLLGRHVRGVQVFGGMRFPFQGVVECVVVPAPAFESKHDVSMFIGEDFVSVSDCITLDYCDKA